MLLELVEDDERSRVHRRDGVLDGAFERVASERELRIAVASSGRAAASSAAIRSAFESPCHALKTTGT